MKTGLLIQVFILFIISNVYTQIINQTSFESYPDEYEYLKSSWESDGFSLPWVNGFNASRGFVDNAFAVSGTKSLRITYPANTYGPGPNGAQAPLQIPPRNEYYVSYWVRFSNNFDWGGTSEGGKLPGLAGGGNCSGCNTCTGSNGFTARLMWRNSGRAVLYLYHMDKPGSCGEDINLRDQYGNIIYFSKGVWYNIVERVKVNTASNYDGEVEIWVNNNQALLKTGIRFVTNGDKVSNFYFSTFHGGSSSAWAPSVTCYTWFDDIKIAQDAASVLTVLPVELSSFKAQETYKGIELHWTTATEKNNSHFIVQKSIDGRDFISLGKIVGKGTSNVSNSYSFLDKSASSNVCFYYRLAQYDFNGTVHFSPIIKVDKVSILEKSENCLQEVIIYPNPFCESTALYSACDDFSGFIKVLDVSGKVLLQAPLTSKTTLGGELPPGVYIVEISVGQDKRFKRVVKSN